MNTVLLYATRFFLSLIAALVCSAEARSSAVRQEPTAIVALASQSPTRGPIVSYRIESPRTGRG